MTELPLPAREILERGSFCHVAALTPLGPHVTPAVFSIAGGRVWVTTSRRSVKARAWRSDPRVAGLVRAGDDAVAFTGVARTHDVLDPSSWARSLAEGPAVSLAAARFTRKNARFFAGYAVDARQVPLAWTPPGRVFVEIEVERSAVFRGERSPLAVGDWPAGDGLPSAERFRASRAGEPPFARLPEEIRAALGVGGRAALAVEGAEGPVVVPALWTIAGAGLYALASEDALALAEPSTAEPRAAMGVDRPSSWRAREMVGAMARGTAAIHVPRRLTSGERSAREVLEGVDGVPVDVALVRIRPERIVWWRGWTSGTATA